MSIQTERIDVAAVTVYPGTAQIIIPFEPLRIQLFYEGASNAALASFDGTADDIRLAPGNPVTLEQRGIRQIFLKRDGAGGAVVQVIVES